MRTKSSVSRAIRRRSSIALAVAVALVLPATASVAQDGSPASLCPPPPDATGASPATFRDVTDGPHIAGIECLASWGVVAGFPDGTFRPSDPVRRDQFAAVLDRLSDARQRPLPAGQLGRFPDASGSLHEPSIVALAEADVVAGFTDGTFRPARTVTRGQAATLLVGIHDHLADTSLPPGSSTFADVAGSAHESAIASLAAAGIVMGHPDGTFRPQGSVTRAQMASLVARLLATVADEDPDGPEDVTFLVDGAVAEPLTLGLDDLAAFPEHVVEVEFLSSGEPQQRVYRGALLLDVLDEAGPVFGTEVRNDQLRHAVLATATDGYRAAVAWGEIDPGFAGTQVLLAYEENGVALDRPRLVVPGDERGGRYVTGVERITLAALESDGDIEVPDGDAIVVDGQVAEPLTLGLDDLAAFPEYVVEVEFLSRGEPQQRVYRGALLLDVLDEAGPVFGTEVRNDQLRHAVLATATDGYRAAVAWGEIDPGFAGTQVLLAYEENGVALDRPRLVVPGDERGGRYVTGVERITLLPVTPEIAGR